MLLDFDGVLCQSVGIKGDAFAALYQDLGDAVMDAVRAYHEDRGGLSRVLKIQHFEKIYRGEEDAVAVRRQIDRFAELVCDKVVAAEEVLGAGALLEAAQRANVPCHVISGTPQDELLDIVERRGMARYFTSVLGSPTRKPAHVAWLLKEGGLPASDCLFIGDAGEDLEAAVTHAVPFLGIVPFGTVSRFPPDVPTRPDLADLPEVLGLLGLAT